MSKQLYSIKLHRSAKFKVFHTLLFLLTLINLGLYLYALISTGFFEYFFAGTKLGIDSMRFPIECLYLLEYILIVFLDIFLMFLLLLSLFMNKIFVYEKHITIFFAPRLFFRQYKCNISAIKPVEAKDLTLLNKIFSYNISSEHLYKFVCFDTEYVVSCRDEKINSLITEINAMQNPTETDEENYDLKKLTKKDYTIIIAIVAYIFTYIQGFFDSFGMQSFP